MRRTFVWTSLLLIVLFGFTVFPQAQTRRVARPGQKRVKRVNHSPIIKSFTSSAAIAAIPCPWAIGRVCGGPDSLVLKLSTDAFDQDNDTLVFEYRVTGGQIDGARSNVQWNLAGLSPSSYTVKVVVKDQHGGVTSRSIRAALVLCDCHPPCHSISFSCPENAEEGKPIVVRASISGGERGIELRYRWSVSSGKINQGQGTDTIEVDTTGLAGHTLKATIEVDGGPPECQREASCEVSIRKKD